MNNNNTESLWVGGGWGGGLHQLPISSSLGLDQKCGFHTDGPKTIYFRAIVILRLSSGSEVVFKVFRQTSNWMSILDLGLTSFRVYNVFCIYLWGSIIKILHGDPRSKLVRFHFDIYVDKLLCLGLFCVTLSKDVVNAYKWLIWISLNCYHKNGKYENPYIVTIQIMRHTTKEKGFYFAINQILLMTNWMFMWEK